MNLDKYNKFVFGIILFILILFLALFFFGPKILDKSGLKKISEKAPINSQEKTQPSPSAQDSERAIPARNLPKRVEF